MDWQPAEKNGNDTKATQGTPGKRKKKGPIIAAIVVVLIAIIGISMCSGGNSKDLVWPSSGLATRLPKPSLKKGEVSSNTDVSFWATLNGASKSDFTDYVAKCKEQGFDATIANETSTVYQAKSEDGLELTIYFYDTEKELSVQLLTPTVSTTTAATSAAVQAETAPASEPAAESPAPAAESPEPAAESPEPANDGGVTPEFKETMDGYEAFMNQYVDFMVKYQNSDNAISMAADYAKMLSQFNDWSQKYDEIDESTLSAADDAYYLEVQGRVMQRLAEIQQ